MTQETLLQIGKLGLAIEDGANRVLDMYRVKEELTGEDLFKGEQVKRCGNSVSPMVPNALVRANLKELCIAQRMPNCSINEEKTGQLRFA